MMKMPKANMALLAPVPTSDSAATLAREAAGESQTAAAAASEPASRPHAQAKAEPKVLQDTGACDSGVDAPVVSAGSEAMRSADVLLAGCLEGCQSYVSAANR